MAEIIDCTHGISEDLDYILLGKKPPRYTDEEWEQMANKEVTPELREGIFQLMDDFFDNKHKK